MKKWTLIFVLILGTSWYHVSAQCAMCRATLENNVANGDVGIAASMNLGILYLFLMPYVAFFVVTYFWRKRSRAEQRLKKGEAGRS